MFRDWFGSRAPRSPQGDYSFRPQLEYLESRLAPSSISPMDGHGHGPPGPGGPPGHGPGGPPGHHGPPGPPGPPGGGNNGISSGVNAHGSFNHSTITDSFNNTITNTYILLPAQQTAVQGFLGIGSLLSSDLHSPALGSLIDDEVALGVDTYLTAFPAVSAAIPSLSGDMAALRAGISDNPLMGTPVGQMIGNVAFDATLHAMVSAQPTI